MQMRIGSARQAAHSDPGSVDKLVELAALFYAQDFYAEAATTFRRAAELVPDDFALWYMTGRALDKSKDNRGAAEMYEKAIATQAAWFDAHPELERTPYTPVHIRLAGVLFDANPARAGEVLRKVIEIDPNDAAAYAGLGTLAEKAGKHDEAIQHFRKALDLSPAYGYAHAGSAAAYKAKGDTEQAAFHRDQTRSDDPYVPVSDPLEIIALKRGWQVDVLLMEANDFLRRRDFYQAERTIQQAIDADASGMRGRTMLGLLRGMQGRYEDAVREYRAVLRLDPNSVPTRMALADSLANANKPDEAEKLLREVVAAEPKALPALDQLARLLNSKQRAADAMSVINQTIEKLGDDPRALTSVAETLARIDQLAEARKLAERIVKASPNTAEARNVLGYALQRSGDEEGAVREWREAIRIAPYLVAPRIQLAQVLYARKDRAGMEQILRAGVEANPMSIDLLNSLAWLLATSPDDAQRSAAEAIAFAEKADILTNSANHAVLDTLAAAYAEAGRFGDAQARVAAAIALVHDAGLARELDDYQKRLELYRKNQPFRDK
jgi:tetratricopeptide (TPR) repeat protein